MSEKRKNRDAEIDENSFNEQFSKHKKRQKKDKVPLDSTASDSIERLLQRQDELERVVTSQFEQFQTAFKQVMLEFRQEVAERNELYNREKLRLTREILESVIDRM